MPSRATENPIIMAANDQDADEIKKLGSSCVTVRFKPPPPREVEMYLRRIAQGEGVEMTGEVLHDYVVRAGGDLRHAINLMQSGGISDSDASKDVSATVSQGLNAFFEAPDPASALAALRTVSLPPSRRCGRFTPACSSRSFRPRSWPPGLRSFPGLT